MAISVKIQQQRNLVGTYLCTYTSVRYRPYSHPGPSVIGFNYVHRIGLAVEKKDSWGILLVTSITTAAMAWL